ncbi:hypothetical protein [Catellatospora vulcania]|uniref:hypothetical protein n=1 Tax=Catellatospora vulcania TaxID=1460450 RepID=UPI001E562D31|nr:hypothetical protein [Catellatospora vulcania]
MHATNLPFRWDVVTPDQVGGLLDGVEPPPLWYADELAACAGRVIARSGDADLIFVGRSLDSMYDLLGGALAGTSWRDRTYRLPLSFSVGGRWAGGRFRPERIGGPQLAQARLILDQLGLSPHALARRARPVAFVDVVYSGETFGELYTLLRSWIEREREPWGVIRRKLRFVGVTSRRDTSPKTWRWQQHADWTRELPARSVLNVSLDAMVWSYLGNNQVKLTRTFPPRDWLAEVPGPRRDEQTRLALAEAFALVELGRSARMRRALVRAMSGEPALALPWSRALIGQLSAGSG